MQINSNSLADRLRFMASPLGMATRSFVKQRADYYKYLADVLRNAAGRVTTLEVFIKDADRYGKMARGVLSRYWAAEYQENGADLVETWRGTVPDNDLLMIGAALRVGGPGALEQALEDTSRISRIIQEAKGSFISTIIVGLFALALAMGMVFAVPFFLLPTIQDAFSFVPVEMWGSSGKNMIAFAAFIKAWGVVILIGVAGLAGYLAYALKHLTGDLRKILDEKFLPFRLYRDFQSAVFIATLASMLKKRGNVSMNMRDGIEVMRDAANPWLTWHCQMMLQRIEDGVPQLEIFATGLLEKDTLYFMLDMIETQGMDEGLQIAGRRTEKMAVEIIAKKAKVLRGVLLFGGLSVVMIVAGWMTRVMGELKAATTLVFA